MSISKVYFTTEDNLKLTGLLYMPDGVMSRLFKPSKVVIFIHGMYSNCLKKRDDIFGEELNKAGIAYFTFNNRGAEVGNLNREVIYGTSFESPYDGKLDIEAAIKAMEKRGFKSINILGHSLGCSKVLNWYPNRSRNVDSIGLLSLTALSDKYRQVAGEKAYKVALSIAKLKVSKGKGRSLLPEAFYPRPISAQTFLDLFDYESEFNTVFYEDENWKAESLNEISEPLFMRYGTVNETITKKPLEVVEFISKLVNNSNLDVNFINGADHSYHGKERILVKEYIEFLNSKS
jgi:hypothetical protein